MAQYDIKLEAEELVDLLSIVKRLKEYLIMSYRDVCFILK